MKNSIVFPDLIVLRRLQRFSSKAPPPDTTFVFLSILSTTETVATLETVAANFKCRSEPGIELHFFFFFLLYTGRKNSLSLKTFSTRFLRVFSAQSIEFRCAFLHYIIAYSNAVFIIYFSRWLIEIRQLGNNTIYIYINLIAGYYKNNIFKRYKLDFTISQLNKS